MNLKLFVMKWLWHCHNVPEDIDKNRSMLRISEIRTRYLPKMKQVLMFGARRSVEDRDTLVTIS
jgi:hypothetical protein